VAGPAASRQRRSVVRRRPVLAVAAVVALAAWAAWSYSSGGAVRIAAKAAGGDTTYEDLRAIVSSWGALAPVVYVLAVVVEVVVAPIPGTLLYAPAGLLFGGFLGGLLSLAGNVLGAALCCVIGAAAGQEGIARRTEGTRLQPHLARLRRRAFWVVLLLRVNPLTSSDLVSYAAGAAGVPAWKVAAGTLVGMAPLCFAQAYLAEQLFTRLPPWALAASAIVIVLVVVLVMRAASEGPTARTPEP
jgi:uncharacterized membrane protein YdjX (TVP38/TMEM64 family)